MADTSLDENKIGLLIWKVSNYWQSKLRKILKPFNLSLNEFLILESIYELSLLNSGLSQNEISKYNSIDVTFRRFLDKIFIHHVKHYSFFIQIKIFLLICIRKSFITI